MEWTELEGDFGPVYFCRIDQYACWVTAHPAIHGVWRWTVYRDRVLIAEGASESPQGGRDAVAFYLQCVGGE